MTKDELRRVSTDLTIEQSAELEQVMAYHGLVLTTEALRFLIRKEARAIRDIAPLFVSVKQQECPQ